MKTNKPEVVAIKDSDVGGLIELKPVLRLPHGTRLICLTDYERLQAENEKLTEALKSLVKGYINLLEAGRDRITSLGGDCDPVSVMEHNDPWLRDARNAIAREEVLPK